MAALLLGSIKRIIRLCEQIVQGSNARPKNSHTNTKGWRGNLAIQM
jgi:hypothetical protein